MFLRLCVLVARLTGAGGCRGEQRGVFGSLRLPRAGIDAQARRDYQAHFCSICHSLRSAGGRYASLLTNYDLTFWLLVLSALEEAGGRAPARTTGACTALPFHRVPLLELRPESRRLTSSLMLALAGAKAEDDRADGDRPWVRWAFWPLSGAWERANRQLASCNFPLRAIEHLGAHQRALESSPDVTLDQLSAPTGDMLAAVFGFLAPHTSQPQHQAALETLGEGLGTFLYLWDVWNDRERDRARGSFNALLRCRTSEPELARRLRGALRQANDALCRLPLGNTEPLLRRQLERLRAQLRLEGPDPGTCRRPRRAPTAGSERWRWGWWLGAAALAGAVPAARASVECDSCDCDCDCCSGCDSCGGEGCSSEGCEGCSSCGCGGGEADACCAGSHAHGCCGEAHGSGPSCSTALDCCNCCACSNEETEVVCCCCDHSSTGDTPGGASRSPSLPKPEEPEEEVPGVRRQPQPFWKRPLLHRRPRRRPSLPGSEPEDPSAPETPVE